MLPSRVWLALLLCLAVNVAVVALPPSFDTAAAQEFDSEDPDTDVPPGNPVLGSDRAGDVEVEGETNYALWTLLAICLIAAGILLVTIERWERRRIDRSAVD